MALLMKWLKTGSGPKPREQNSQGKKIIHMAKIWVAQVKPDTEFGAHISLIHEGSVIQGDQREEPSGQVGESPVRRGVLGVWYQREP